MKKSSLVPVLAAVLLSACAVQGHTAQQLHGPEFSMRETRQSSQSWPGVVIGMQDIVLVGDKSSVPTAVGGVTGGVLGAAIGNKVGQGQGKKIATLLGGTLGAAGGASAGSGYAEQSSKVQGVQLRVQLTDGTNRIYIYQQPVVPTEQFVVGSRVIVTQLPGGYHVSPM